MPADHLTVVQFTDLDEEQKAFKDRLVSLLGNVDNYCCADCLARGKQKIDSE